VIEPLELFSEAWAREWCRILNDSDAYRQAGAAWTGAIALVLDADPARGVTAPRAVHLDLAGGSCQEARATSGAVPAATPTVIGASPEIWRRVLAGDIDPLFAIMGGRLQLRSGSLAGLMPHARGAKELVACAREVPTRFPEGWETP
jgi:putative sterol carrier protein